MHSGFDQSGRNEDRDQLAEFAKEQLGSLPAFTTRRMFGGTGFYSGSLFFACIYDGQLYFKTAEADRERYRAYGSGPFSYEGGALISLWEVPADIMEDRDELILWARRAIAAAREARHEQPGGRRRKRRK